MSKRIIPPSLIFTGMFLLLFSTGGLTYSASGVHIAAGDQLVANIKPLAASTSRAGCTADLGGFGGIFDLKCTDYHDPLLVSGTDGVGTKLKVRYGFNGGA